MPPLPIGLTRKEVSQAKAAVEAQARAAAIHAVSQKADSARSLFIQYTLTPAQQETLISIYKSQAEGKKDANAAYDQLVAIDSRRSSATSTTIFSHHSEASSADERIPGMFPQG